MANLKAIVLLVIIGAAAGTGVFFAIWLTADQGPIVEDKLQCVFTAESESAIGKCFTSSFKKVISANYMFHLMSDFKSYYGNYVSLSVASSPDADGYYSYNATMAWSTVSGFAKINRLSRKLETFYIGRFTYLQSYLESITLDSIYSDFEGLPSNGTLLLARDDTILHTINASNRLAVGSTFKLFVLEALVDKINTDPGTSWTTTYPVQDKYKSLQTGGIVSIVNGTPLPLKTYADFMINISDNSATDHLISFLNRTFVESYLPAGYQLPLLTTAEMFKLKYLISDTELNTYLLMTEGQKRLYLNTTVAALDVNDISSSTDWTANMESRQQVEWFFNVTEIYAIQKLTKVYSSTHMNWGLATLDMGWYQVSYKGGSDVGVYAMAHALQATNGTWFYATYMANNYERFDYLNYNEYVFGQNGYDAICIKLLSKLAIS